MLARPGPKDIRIVIALNADSDPIEGRLLEPEPHASAFRGWPALTALFERIRDCGRAGDRTD
jgi:hypothetical protein